MLPGFGNTGPCYPPDYYDWALSSQALTPRTG